MKATLRAKFMLWLVLQTLLVYATISIPLYLFNLHERREHPTQVEEEREEFFIMLGLMAATLPVVTVAAWLVSRQLLRPLQAILEAAESIRQGDLDRRLEAPVKHDEIGRLARTLNDAFDNYQRALQRLDRFSMDAAHQLRNPLAAMRTNAEICLQKHRATAEYQDTLGQILEDLSRLNHTVNQLLMLARLSRGDLGELCEELDFRQLVQAVVEPMEAAFVEKRIRLELRLPERPLPMRGVPRLLEQAIANLLDNALRMTPEDSAVEVLVETRAPGQAVLAVSDSGPGLPETMREVAVDQFGKTIGHGKEGAGLGLAIAADVARAHQGKITASNSPLGGARFEIELPCSRH